VLAALGVRVAALDDEVGDDAVELDAVVEPAVGELLEVLDGLRGRSPYSSATMVPLLVSKVARLDIGRW
jgi:hypothetical protein